MNCGHGGGWSRRVWQDGQDGILERQRQRNRNSRKLALMDRDWCYKATNKQTNKTCGHLPKVKKEIRRNNDLSHCYSMGKWLQMHSLYLQEAGSELRINLGDSLFSLYSGHLWTPVSIMVREGSGQAGNPEPQSGLLRCGYTRKPNNQQPHPWLSAQYSLHGWGKHWRREFVLNFHLRILCALGH